MTGGLINLLSPVPEICVSCQTSPTLFTEPAKETPVPYCTVKKKIYQCILTAGN